jgi:hypothetical protein
MVSYGDFQREGAKTKRYRIFSRKGNKLRNKGIVAKQYYIIVLSIINVFLTSEPNFLTSGSPVANPRSGRDYSVFISKLYLYNISKFDSVGN